jgi:Flp pilus assembly protein TadD
MHFAATSGLLLCALCIMVALPTLAQEVMPELPIPPAVSVEQVDAALAEARAAREAVEDNNRFTEGLTNRVDMLLSFLEVGSGVAALLVALAAVLGITSLRDLRRGLRQQFDDDRDALLKRFNEERTALESRADAANRQIDALRAELAAELAEVKSATQLVKSVREQGDRAIRALTLVQLGEEQLADSNWAAAKRTFLEAYRLDDHNRAVNYFLGELYIMERNLDKAEYHLRRSHIDDQGEPDDDAQVFPPAEAALAYVLRLRGDKEPEGDSRNEFFASAERRFLKALRLDRSVRDINDESVYGMLGALYRQWKRFDDAISAYEKASRITPNRSYPLNNLAMLYYMRGETSRSTPLFLRAIELAERRIADNPADYWAYFDRITGQLACTMSEEAEEAFEEVIGIVQVVGPLESFRNGLRVMRDSGRNNSETVHRLIARVEDKLALMKANGTGTM